MKKALGLFVALLFVVECIVPPPTLEQLDKADFGIAPTDPLSLVQAYIEKAFDDPQSVVIEWKTPEPVKGWWYAGDVFFFRFVVYGWVWKAKINFKDRTGSYVGFQDCEFHFFYIDGKPMVERALISHGSH